MSIQRGAPRTAVPALWRRGGCSSARASMRACKGRGAYQLVRPAHRSPRGATLHARRSSDHRAWPSGQPFSTFFTLASPSIASLARGPCHLRARRHRRARQARYGPCCMRAKRRPACAYRESRALFASHGAAVPPTARRLPRVRFRRKLSTREAATAERVARPRPGQTPASRGFYFPYVS